MKSKREELKYRGTNCLNCNQSLDVSEKYCHNCGQLNSTKKLTFEDFFEEYFSGIVAYDSRLSRTLSALLFHPGKISKDYIQGKRQRYANPYKFYLSVSIIFFLAWGFFGNNNNEENVPPVQIDAVEEALQDTSLVPQEHLVPREQNVDLYDSIFPVKELDSVYVPESRLDSLELLEQVQRKWLIFRAEFEKTGITNPYIAMEELGYAPSTMNRWLYNKVIDSQDFSSHPEAFINYIVGKLPFIIFFFLPFFTLFISLLYYRSSFSYMDHLIFTFHTQTCWFVFYGIGLILGEITGWGFMTTAANLVFLFYLYKALRKFYGQRRLKTILKFVFLNIIFLILALIAAVISILASFALY